MNTDYRLELDFTENRKTRRLVKQCGVEGLLGLLRLFAYASKNRPKGDLSGLDDHKITDICEFDNGNFASILHDIGWLDGATNEYEIHEWELHQPYVASAPARSEIARKGGKARSESMTPEEKSAHAKKMVGARSTCYQQDTNLLVASKKLASNGISKESTCSISFPILSDSDSISDSPLNPPGDSGAKTIVFKAVEITSNRTFPPTEPKPNHQPSHILWRLEMSNEALLANGVIKKEIAAATEMLKLKYSENEIMSHYEYQRDRRDTGYSFHLLQFDIASLHKRAPGERVYANGNRTASPPKPKSDEEAGIRKLAPGEHLKYLNDYSNTNANTKR